MFVEAIEAILQDRFTPAAVRAIEAGGDAGPRGTRWPRPDSWNCSLAKTPAARD